VVAAHKHADKIKRVLQSPGEDGSKPLEHLERAVTAGHLQEKWPKYTEWAKKKVDRLRALHAAAQEALKRGHHEEAAYFFKELADHTEPTAFIPVHEDVLSEPRNKIPQEAVKRLSSALYAVEEPVRYSNYGNPPKEPTREHVERLKGALPGLEAAIEEMGQHWPEYKERVARDLPKLKEAVAALDGAVSRGRREAAKHIFAHLTHILDHAAFLPYAEGNAYGKPEKDVHIGDFRDVFAASHRLKEAHERALRAAKHLQRASGGQIAKAETRNIPVERLRWVDRPKERRELKKKGKVRYLLPNHPDGPKFPITNKDGSINCRLVRAAISRAAQHGYPEVERKARRIYERHCKKKED